MQLHGIRHDILEMAFLRMQILSTARRLPLSASVLLMLMLGFAVFGWGLHYKLSLYSHSVSPSVRQPAKLLSQQERSTPDAQQLAQVEPAIVPMLFAALLFSLFPPSFVSRLVRTTAALPSHESGLTEALLRRPPPAKLQV